MKVLLIFSSSELGGAERSLSRMAFHSTSKVTYELATLGGEGPWCDWVRSQGHEPLVFDKGLVRSLWRLILYSRRNQVDVIYVCGIRASLILRLFRFFLQDVKLVHGVRWNPVSDSRLDRFFRLIEISTHRLVDGWITNSDIAKQVLVSRCQIPSDKVSVIYNGLDTFPAKVIPLVERPLEVLTVANLNPRKGHREFLHVIRKVVNAVPGARFVFIGRDDMAGTIQEAIVKAGLTEVVRYEGFQSNVSQWYEREQLFVLPSLWGEGFPTSILEAFAYGLPVVAYTIDGIPELVADQEDGVLIQPGCEEEIGDAIVGLLTDHSKAQGMGEVGRKKVKQSFSVEQCAENHRVCFEKVIGS